MVGSTIANESDDVLYTWAGPEIAVASTKAYSTQLAVIYMIALYMADQLNTVSKEDMARYMADLQAPARAGGGVPEGQGDHPVFCLPGTSTPSTCTSSAEIVDYAASLEASLKLKEISYIHSEAYNRR